MLVGLQQLRQGLADILLLDCWEQSERKERLQTPLFSGTENRDREGVNDTKEKLIILCLNVSCAHR